MKGQCYSLGADICAYRHAASCRLATGTVKYQPVAAVDYGEHPLNDDTGETLSQTFAKSRRFFRLLRPVLLPVMLHAILFAPLARSQVLCVGSDGHISFEQSRQGRCVDGILEAAEPGYRLPPAIIESPSANHCGSCSDFALLLEFGPRQAEALYSISTAAEHFAQVSKTTSAAAFITAAAAAQPWRAAPTVYHPSPHAAPHLLSSVRLLI